VTSSASEAKEFIERLTNSDEFGDAGKRVLLEAGLEGKELSYIILTDGTNFISLAPTRDHKRAFDNDEGPNTGGMGTYSTDGMLTRELEEQILEKIVRPTLAGLRKEGMEYRGFIFFGLMLTKDGPKVLEYNCRLAIRKRKQFCCGLILILRRLAWMLRVGSSMVPARSGSVELVFVW